MLTPFIVVSLLFAPLFFSVVAERFFSRPFKPRSALAIGLALSFLFFALGHFVQTQAMIEMLPPWVPERRALVYLTGLAEVLAAIGLFSNRWRQASAIAAASMLVVFFPANIYAAVNAVGMGGHTWGPIYLLIRVPLQLLLLAVALAILDRFPVGRGRDRRQ